MKSKILTLLTACSGVILSTSAYSGCNDLPNHAQVTSALQSAIGNNGGFNLQMWASIVDRSGIVCVVAKSANPGDQWPGSRVISAQKANTANSFSLPGLSISTANLWAATQPGGSLFGLQHSNPVDPTLSYKGNISDYGTSFDQLVGLHVGGINVFGGGLALYDSSGELLGALGVSGDTSCADHNIAWRVRDELGLDYVPFGPGQAFGGTVGDNIIYDIAPSNPGMSGFESFLSKSGFGHPTCGNNEDGVNKQIVTSLPLGDGDSTP